MTRLVKKYFEYPEDRKEWCVTGEYGSLCFWVTAYKDSHYGGVESHYNEKSRPEYLSEKDPSHDDCHANGGKCWHDGTSLWASEYWIPYILPQGNDGIWRTLQNYYDERIIPEENKHNG